MWRCPTDPTLHCGCRSEAADSWRAICCRPLASLVWTGVLVAALCSLMACSADRQRVSASPEEIESAVWYVEDVAHGLDRNPAELRVVDSSPGMLRLAAWALGNTTDGQQVAHPEPLAARRRRWPLLAQGLGEGRIKVRSGGQLVIETEAQVGKDANDDLWPLLHDAVRQENVDRVTTINILIGMLQIRSETDRVARAVDAFHRARRYHAEAAGGTLWTEPLPSNSPDEATPSTSEAERLPRRAP